jgi:hypothetical protein
MSTTTTVVLLLAALVGGPMIVKILVRKAVHKGVETLDRNVIHKTSHATGSDFVQNPLVFRTSAPFAAVREALVSNITVRREATMAPALFLMKVEDEEPGQAILHFRLGGKLGHALDCEVRLRTDDTHVVGTVAMTEWRTQNTVIQAVGVMQSIRDQVSEQVRTLDSHAEFSNSAAR